MYLSKWLVLKILLITFIMTDFLLEISLWCRKSLFRLCVLLYSVYIFLVVITINNTWKSFMGLSFENWQVSSFPASLPANIWIISIPFVTCSPVQDRFGTEHRKAHCCEHGLCHYFLRLLVSLFPSELFWTGDFMRIWHFGELEHNSD